ncbi:MAG: ATP-grasp domain-containing protein [Pseudomonadales bacterium]|jgi:glutathione synthase/RimK-type ligase-like ATP-grasp enzyme|nr:ATP-grasp domain-containing protein [Pseudomonadales bacterium]
MEKEFFIANKWLFEEAQKTSLNPQPIDDALFCIQRNSHQSPLYIGTGHLPFNSSTTTSLVNDKYSCRLVLQYNQLPNIPFWRPDQSSWSDFWQQNHPVVAKPVYGSRSRGIHLLEKETDRNELDLNIDYIYEKFVDGMEWRVVVFYDQILTIHQKQYEQAINVAGENHRVALAKQDWPTEIIEISLKTARSFGLNYGAIDFIWPKNQQPLILELNACPGIYKLRHPDEGEGVYIAPLLIVKIKSEFLS